ncbi:MAG: single-stranded DNA-binding protein [Erysipelotrichaceae bacterium]|nr:single-stranded DNA-binding protein [Erysipelotrichaceae bacterium]
MINRVVLVGRLTKDVEVKKTPSGLSVAQFTVACDRWKSGDQEPQADFINCVSWRQAADFLGQYARKGNRIGVDGRLQTRNYERDGQKIYVVEVVAENVRLLESKNNEGSERQTGSYRKSDYNNDDAKEYVADEFDISGDDLPF